MVDEFLTAFKDRFGYVNCRQLTGLNLKTPEGLKEYFERVHDTNVLRECLPLKKQ